MSDFEEDDPSDMSEPEEESHPAKHRLDKSKAKEESSRQKKEVPKRKNKHA